LSLRPNTWITSLGWSLSLSSIPTTWRERWVFVSASHENLSCAPWRNLRDMTPDLQGCSGQCTLGSLTTRLVGQFSLGRPASSPHTILYRLWRATCRPISTDPSPLLSIDFPCGPLSLPSSSYIAGCFRLVTQFAATC
jgi:hypothetical protein